MMDKIEIFNERLAAIKQQLYQLYTPDEAVIWLITPQASLGDQQPVDLLWSEDGYRRVESIIKRVLDSAFI